MDAVYQLNQVLDLGSCFLFSLTSSSDIGQESEMILKPSISAPPQEIWPEHTRRCLRLITQPQLDSVTARV